MSTKLTEDERQAFIDKISGLGWEHCFSHKALTVEGYAWKTIESRPRIRKMTHDYVADCDGKAGERSVYEAVCRVVCASENGDDFEVTIVDLGVFPDKASAPFSDHTT